MGVLYSVARCLCGNATGKTRTAQVTTEHEIEHHEAIVIVLEGEPHVHDIGMINLL